MANAGAIPPNDRRNEKGDQHRQPEPAEISVTPAPNPFAVIFKREYNFFMCWYMHLSHNFNAIALDVLYHRLSNAYKKYDPATVLVQNEEEDGDYDDIGAATAPSLEPSPLTDGESRGRSLGAVIDSFIQLKETADLILQHMHWLEEIELETLLAVPELYCRKPNSSLVSLMILCSKTRLFIRCVSENLRTRADYAASQRQRDAKYDFVDETFVQTFVPHYLKLEYAKKPRVLKPCTCDVRLDPLNLL